jgi:hypothetical protein
MMFGCVAENGSCSLRQRQLSQTHGTAYGKIADILCKFLLKRPIPPTALYKEKRFEFRKVESMGMRPRMMSHPQPENFEVR